jgi:hypothetical protein
MLDPAKYGEYVDHVQNLDIQTFAALPHARARGRPLDAASQRRLPKADPPRCRTTVLEQIVAAADAGVARRYDESLQKPRGADDGGAVLANLRGEAAVGRHDRHRVVASGGRRDVDDRVVTGAAASTSTPSSVPGRRSRA